MILDQIQCSDIQFIINIINLVVKLFKIAVPIILILLIVIDFASAVMAQDEKKMSDAKNKAIKRIVYGIILFLIPTIVFFLFDFLPQNTNGGFMKMSDAIKCYRDNIK